MSDQSTFTGANLLSNAVLSREFGVPPEKQDDNIVALLPASGRDGQGAAASALGRSRDWLSAIELVEEAREAIRIADERNEGLQAQLSQVLEEAAREINALKRLQQEQSCEITQLREDAVAAQTRAVSAEERAVEAEAWLCRLHDCVMNSLGRAVSRPPAAKPLEVLRPMSAVG